MIQYAVSPNPGPNEHARATDNRTEIPHVAAELGSMSNLTMLVLPLEFETFILHFGQFATAGCGNDFAFRRTLQPGQVTVMLVATDFVADVAGLSAG